MPTSRQFIPSIDAAAVRESWVLPVVVKDADPDESEQVSLSIEESAQVAMRGDQ
jgi:hypothetical protein